MKIIVGLGNIGAEYDGTRHNFGFLAVDRILEKFGAKWNNKSKFSAQVAETTLPCHPELVSGSPGNSGEIPDQVRNDNHFEKVLFVKPTTYYNLSGMAVRAVRDFYGLNNDDILVIHDEISLPTGTLRTRSHGGDAGNHGIENLIQHIGENFARIRIGSGQDQGDNGSTLPDDDRRDFVLSQPTATEQEQFDELLPRIEQIVLDFIAGNFDETTYQPK